MAERSDQIGVTVITVSDRCSAGEREDRSGPAAEEALNEAGFPRVERRVIPDGQDAVAEAIHAAAMDGAEVILTLGGTGVGPRDETPEGTVPLLRQELPGLAEELRRRGGEKLPAAALSRGLAGITGPFGESARASVVVNLPGSVGGAVDGVEYLAPILPHLIDQLGGGDH